MRWDCGYGYLLKEVPCIYYVNGIVFYILADKRWWRITRVWCLPVTSSHRWWRLRVSQTVSQAVPSCSIFLWITFWNITFNGAISCNGDCPLLMFAVDLFEMTTTKKKKPAICWSFAIAILIAAYAPQRDATRQQHNKGITEGWEREGQDIILDEHPLDEWIKTDYIVVVILCGGAAGDEDV